MASNASNGLLYVYLSFCKKKIGYFIPKHLAEGSNALKTYLLWILQIISKLYKKLFKKWTNCVGNGIRHQSIEEKKICSGKG